MRVRPGAPWKRPVVVIAGVVALSPVLVGGAPTAAAHSVAKTVVYLGDHELYRAPAGHPTHRTAISQAKGAAAASAEVSPTGKQVAVLSLDGRLYVENLNGRHRLVIKRFDLSTALPSTHVPAGFAWSPDGASLYFGSQFSESSPPFYDAAKDRLFVAKLSAKKATVSAVDGGTGLLWPAASPNGNKLAAVSNDYQSKPEIGGTHYAAVGSIVTLTLATGDVSDPLYTGTFGPQLSQLSWSPDGARIAFVRRTSGNKHSVDASDIRVVKRGTVGFTVAARGFNKYWLQSPTWRNAHHLWFSRRFQPDGSSDDPQAGNGDLYSVKLKADGAWALMKNLTKSPHRDETAPSLTH
jgi:dipeptidyl aminopeptidase/acylaminoacyl peptidase